MKILSATIYERIIERWTPIPFKNELSHLRQAACAYEKNSDITIIFPANMADLYKLFPKTT